MAKDTLANPAQVLKAKGMDDGMPVSPYQTWYRTAGMFADRGVMARLPGKILARKYDVPVVAIHSDQQGNFWVQTTDELLIYTKETFA